MKYPLFNEDDVWKEHWIGMPEFEQDRQSAYATIIVRFNNQEDLHNFAKLIGQRLTRKTKSIWFPFKSHWGNGEGKRWGDES